MFPMLQFAAEEVRCRLRTVLYPLTAFGAKICFAVKVQGVEYSTADVGVQGFGYTVSPNQHTRQG